MSKTKPCAGCQYKIQRVYCAACAADDKALHAWRTVGGEIPRATCAKVHGKPCKECGLVLTRNPTGRCDPCYNEFWRITYGFEESPKEKDPEPGTVRTKAGRVLANF